MNMTSRTPADAVSGLIIIIVGDRLRIHTHVAFCPSVIHYSCCTDSFNPLPHIIKSSSDFLLWPPKARPLYFTADFFKFVSMDERPAMGSPPNSASKSEVVSIFKCPQKFRGGPLPNLGRKKNQILDHILRDCRTRCTASRTKVASTNQNASVNLQCPLKHDLISVTFDPEMAEIRSVIVTHPSTAITLQLTIKVATCLVTYFSMTSRFHI